MALTKPARSRLLIGCVLGIGLALLFVRSSAYVWAQEPGDRPVSLDVILLIDNSWSMSHGNPVTGVPPSDPEELRIRAAKFLVDYLRANAETVEANYRVGVVSFGGEVSDVIPLRLLQDDTVREGIQAEEIRRTDFLGPLQFATKEFREKSFGTGNRMAVILLTDGRPNLTDVPMSEQELLDHFEDLAPLVGELQEGGVSLFVLGIGDAQEDRDNWTRLIPPEHYISITSATELADVYHDIVVGLIGVAVSEGETIPAGQTVSVEVEPYLERVVFSFVKSDPAIRVVLIPPTGAVLTPTIGGTDDVHHSIYRITNPDAGEWRVFWEGEGEVRYWVDKQYPLIRVEPIESASPVGQPITITASLVRNGEVVVDPSLHLEAEITLPGGDIVTQALSPTGGGRYTGGYEDVRVEGTYTVIARAFLGGQLLTVRPLPVTVDVFAVPMPTPSLTPSASATPGVVAQVTATATPPVPTATPQPIVGSVLSVIERYRLVLVLIGIGIVVAISIVVALRGISVVVMLRRRPVAWIGRIRNAPDSETALKEFQKGVESERMRLEPLEEKAAHLTHEGTIALYERHKTRGEPIEIVFDGIARGAANEADAIRRGIAEALVDVLIAEGEKDVLKSYLYFARKAGEREHAADEIFDTLCKSAMHARKKAYTVHKKAQEEELTEERRTDLLHQYERYSLVSSLMDIYANFWLRRGTFAADVERLLRQSEELLDNPLLEKATFRDELYTLYHLLYDVLGEIRFAEDTIPLSLPSVSPNETDKAERTLRAMLGQYAARDGVAAVLKHFANQPLYPLKQFLHQLDKAEQEFEEQRRTGSLLVLDEVILRFLLRKWRDAAESDQEYRRAALSSLDLVNERAYIPEGKREITIRVALHNVSERTRIGRAEHVSVTVEPPLTAYILDPPLGSIPLILPWETDVTYALVVGFPDDLDPGKQSIPLKVEFSDLAEGDRIFSDMVEIELLKQEESLDEIEYDALALAEKERMTGDRDELRQLIEGAIATSYPEPCVLFLEDVKRIISEITDSSQIREALGWEDLSGEEKSALLELEELLASEGRAHLKMVEICSRLSKRHPDRLVNWNRILRGLVHKGYLREKSGLYCFRVGLLRTWIAKHEADIARD